MPRGPSRSPLATTTTTTATTAAATTAPTAAATDPAPGADARWLQLDHQLCFALYATSLAMTKVYKPLLAPLGLTYPQYLVMLVLWEQDGLGVRELGARLNLDSGTLTPLLKRLAAQGLLQRDRDTGDERRLNLRLSAEGRALRQRAQDIPQAVLCATACDIDTVSRLTQELGGLRARLLQAAGAEPPAPPAPPAPPTRGAPTPGAGGSVRRAAPPSPGR
jgi:DNA-binding MarR family transcriptional regulator